MRNVVADEVHFIVSGGARLETDFGAFDVGHGDFVLVPRAVAWRYVGIGEPVLALIAACEGTLAIDPDPRAVLNTALDVDEPVPFGDAAPGAYEVVVRHRGGTTSYFYEFDPLGGQAARGAPQVRRFNIESAKGLGVASGGISPGRLIDDTTGRSLFYHLGSRRSDRPPIHCNADYDEIIVYAGGPGAYGGMTVPGTVAWTPKGIAHHGAEEDVPEPYQAWLLETRAELSMTEAGPYRCAADGNRRVRDPSERRLRRQPNSAAASSSSIGPVTAMLRTPRPATSWQRRFIIGGPPSPLISTSLGCESPNTIRSSPDQ